MKRKTEPDDLLDAPWIALTSMFMYSPPLHYSFITRPVRSLLIARFLNSKLVFPALSKLCHFFNRCPMLLSVHRRIT